MTDAEKTLIGIENVLEYHLGDWRPQYPDAVAALDALLYHKARAGTIHRHGYHWFSDEDYQRIATASLGSRDFRTISGSGSMYATQVLAATERCSSAEDFTHLMAEALMTTFMELDALHKRIVDMASLQPTAMFYPTDKRP